MTKQAAYEAHRRAYREANNLPIGKARGRKNYGAWLQSLVPTNVQQAVAKQSGLTKNPRKTNV